MRTQQTLLFPLMCPYAIKPLSRFYCYHGLCRPSLLRGLPSFRGCGLLPCGARAPGLASPWSWGSLALGCRLSGCGPWAPLLRGRWDLPSSGLEPVPPASAGKFFNTEPPEESHGRLNQIFTDSFFHEAEGTVVLEAGFSSILYEFLEGNNEERSKFLGKKERRREKSLGFPEMIFTNLSKFTSL